MGMMDDKRYLTGKTGLLEEGDTFRLHGAGIAGKVRKPGTQDMTDEAFLDVSKDGTADAIRVYTTGAAIVGQVQRIDQGDRSKMGQAGGWPLRLGTLPQADAAKNAAFILVPQESPAVAEDMDPEASPGQTPGSGF